MDSFPHLARPNTEAAPHGFTLVEMMVVLTIITLIMLVIVTSQTTFNRSLILTDTAYTVAFSLREAQTLGLSSRGSGNVYNAGYGIRFSSVTPSSYILFADTVPESPGINTSFCPGHAERTATSPDAHPGNCLYDENETPAELVRTYTLNQGYTISKFCGTRLEAPVQEACSDTDFETMHITFMRPSTNTRIYGLTGAQTPIPLNNATIHLRSPDGAAERCIEVSRAGLIAVATCD